MEFKVGDRVIHHKYGNIVEIISEKGGIVEYITEDNILISYYEEIRLAIKHHVRPKRIWISKSHIQIDTEYYRNKKIDEILS